LLTVRILDYNMTPKKSALICIGDIKNCKFNETDSSGETRFILKKGKRNVNIVEGGYIGNIKAKCKGGMETHINFIPAATIVR